MARNVLQDNSLQAGLNRIIGRGEKNKMPVNIIPDPMHKH